MPGWLSSTLITAAVALAFWWLEMRIGSVLTELRAIRRGIDRMSAEANKTSPFA